MLNSRNHHASIPAFHSGEQSSMMIQIDKHMLELQYKIYLKWLVYLTIFFLNVPQISFRF
jgi:hypothetical protein